MIQHVDDYKDLPLDTFGVFKRVFHHPTDNPLQRLSKTYNALNCHQVTCENSNNSQTCVHSATKITRKLLWQDMTSTICMTGQLQPITNCQPPLADHYVIIKKESWQTTTGRLETATTTTTFHQWQQQGTCAANPSRIHFNIKRSEHYLNQYLNIFKQRVHLFRTKTNKTKHGQTPPNCYIQ